MEAVVPLLVDSLTLGDLARLHEALCDRSVEVSSEMRHVVRGRLGLVRAPSSSSTLRRILSTYLSHCRTRCRECGAVCRRQCRVCFRCANDARSYRSMVSRNDLRWTADGWQIKERRLRKALETVPVIACTPAGAYLYWRREAVAALAAP